MERCVISSFSGHIERIEWRMPHVELLVRKNDGVGTRLTWLNIHQLSRVEIFRDTLRIGDQVVVTAIGRRDDVLDGPMLLSNIRRPSDGWEWSQEPQGC
jgi:hypothetical protein